MRKHLVTRIRYLFLLVVSLPLIACSNKGRGSWLHDKEGGVWYQGVQLTSEPIKYGDAVRTFESHKNGLLDPPGCNRTLITLFDNGNYAIKIGFKSLRELDDAMEQNLIPALLDGVPVVIDDLVGEIQLE